MRWQHISCCKRVQWGFGTLAMGSQLPFAAVDPNVCYADKPDFCWRSYCRRSISSQALQKIFSGVARSPGRTFIAKQSFTESVATSI
jgi:hypothetical protein